MLYNGSNGQSYGTIVLNGVIPDQQNGYGAVSFTSADIQNGPDGFALIGPQGQVVQFLSYEGEFQATNGPAAGLTSTDINVEENGAAAGTSVHLRGFGEQAGDFLWGSGPATPGAGNGFQTFGPRPAPEALTISQIQGAGHTSAYLGRLVVTEGVVTAVDTNGARGFWVQSVVGDGDDATSDAVFVFTGSAPTVAVGQVVKVEGIVEEFRGGEGSLPVTEIIMPTVTPTGATAPLPAAVVLGAGGRPVPTEQIDDDSFAVFDPANDAIDFFESLEGMRVTVPDAQAVAITRTNSSGASTWVVADGGAGATGMNARDGITISPGDYNPEHIQVFVDNGIVGGPPFRYATGEDLGDVTGVMGYFGGQYQVLATGQTADPVDPANPGAPRGPGSETTTLQGDGAHLEVASYNVANLYTLPLGPNPTDAQLAAYAALDPKFEALAADIVENLGSPDIISLIEMQDGNDGTLSAAETAERLIQEIIEAGGPTYVYVEVAPTTPDSTGGAPGGNIRNGFLYNPERVEYVEGSAVLLPDPEPHSGEGSGDSTDAFSNSRMPLAAEFEFHGETVTVISVHNYARIGSDETFGANQPPEDAGDQRRIEQTAAINAWLAANPDAQVIVVGDFNGFYWEGAQTQLTTQGGLTNLTFQLPPEERYTYVYAGNSQQLDHMFVSSTLADGTTAFDIVHLNTGVLDYTPSDHDAVMGLIYVNTAPVGAFDRFDVAEDQEFFSTFSVLANDTDRNGDTLSAELLSGPALGYLELNADGSFTYVADADVLDLLGEGETALDQFTYRVSDGYGGFSAPTTVQLTIRAADDEFVEWGTNKADLFVDHNGPEADTTWSGGNGNDTAFGNGGADALYGGNGIDTLWGGTGRDVLDGGAGDDKLYGGEGDDVLFGGRGRDLLVGGEGRDTFVLSWGDDVGEIADFNPDEDRIVFTREKEGAALDLRSYRTDPRAELQADGAPVLDWTIDQGAWPALRAGLSVTDNWLM